MGGRKKVSQRKADLDYFDRGNVENPTFWSRLGGQPSFDGLTVLDAGCGHGSLCVDVASKGADKVLGIDISERRVRFAQENLRRHYPHLNEVLEFRCCEVADLPHTGFDLILSKDTFEHVLNLNSTLAQMKRRLRHHGRIYAGFAPLYNSVRGDHGRLRTPLPWGHVLLPETLLLRRLNKRRQNKVASVHDLGLNKLSLEEYRTLIYTSGLYVSYFRVNVSRHPVSRLFSLIRRIPLLEEYFTHNLYCILENRP
jgi:2-polyprenyl-3-methyl-5-hydroxy-6-metoxy-1,4-benzoquinol methylase